MYVNQGTEDIDEFMNIVKQRSFHTYPQEWYVVLQESGLAICYRVVGPQHQPTQYL